MLKNKGHTAHRNHALLSCLSVLLCLLLLFAVGGSACAESADEVYTVAQVESLRDGIVAYSGAAGGQDMIDRVLTPNAGISAEFYVIALSQSGSYRFDGYESALLSYLDSHTVGSAASREKYALALAAAGSTNRYIADTADEAIGGLGIMSLVFGLHLLNNGYDSAAYSADGLLSEILSYRMSDGGWAVMGSYGDVDVTAMVLQALAPHYGGRSDVTAAVDDALRFLSDKQLNSGGYRTMGAENCESSAQVIIALSALSIDAQRDGRFIKNGRSVMNAMLDYRAGGGFSHTGGGADPTATEEAFCALTAYARYCYGQGSLYVLDHVNHAAPSDSGSGASQGGSSQGGSQSGANSGGSGGASSSKGSVSGGSSGAQNQQNNGSSSGTSNGSGGGEAGGSDTGGGRVIVINGQRFIEATTPAGEVTTIPVEETTADGKILPRPTHGGFQSAVTADSNMQSPATADESGQGGNYKPYAILAVIGAAGVACGVLFALKKRNKKHFIAVGVIAAAGIVFILLTDFKSADSYQQPAKTDGAIQVTLSIRCDTITGREKVNYYVPDDGVILDATTCYADEGDTVYDVLMRAAAEKNILIDNRGAQGAAYIAGINSLYEFDYGELSGWMYRVNGEFPDVGCQSCTVSDGDVIEWVYTTNIGKDLG